MSQDTTAAKRLAEGTHIPHADFRWFTTSEGERSLQQRCTTPGGTMFWKDVPEVSEDAE